MLFNRRNFIKSVGSISVIPQSLFCIGVAEIKQGNRELKDITPDEIDEILDWIKIDKDSIITVEEADGPPKPSLHPVYQFTYIDEDESQQVPYLKAEFYYQCSYEYNEYDIENIFIRIGDISTRCYPLGGPVEIVEWFLRRGFKVFKTLINNQ